MNRKKNEPIEEKVTGETDNPEWGVVIAIMFVGGLLRFYNLGLNALWLDEAATVSLSQGGFWQIWQNTVAGEFNPPLFHWIEYLMMSGFGNNEWVLRFVPAFFGVMTIPMFYLIGKEFKNKYVGIIMAGLCAFSPFLIYYSQEARAYSLMLFLVAGATLFFFRGLRTNDLKDWVAFAVIGAIAFWTHFYALVIVAVLFAYILMLEIRDNKNPVKQVKAILVSVCIWILISFPLLSQLQQLIAKRTLTPPTYGIQGIGIIYDTFRGLSAFSDIVLIIFFVLFLIGIIGGTYFFDKKKAIFFAWVTVLTFLFSLGASYIIPMLPRYLIFMSIFFYLGIACSYEWVQRVTKKDAMWAAGAIVLLAGLMAMPFVTTYYAGETKDDWRGTSRYLETAASPGDTIVAVPNYIELPMDYYYNASAEGTTVKGASGVADLESAKQNATGTVWYVVTGDISAVDTKGESVQWLVGNTVIKQQFRGGITVLRNV